MDRLDFIDTRFGTANQYHFSQGNCLPLTGVPFGMNYLSVETSQSRGSWWFHPDDPTFAGIRLTHQPSPWVGDFSTFSLLPVSGPVTKGDVFHNTSSYRPSEARFQPHLIEVFSQRHRILTKVTASIYTFSCHICFENGSAGLIIHNPGQAVWQFSADGKTAVGQVQNVSECQDKDLTLFVHLEFSQPVQQKLMGEALENKSLDDQTKTSFTYFQFGDDVKDLEIMASTSFISSQQALLNWQREFPKTFEESLAKSRQSWNTYLNRIQVEDKDFQKSKNFYQHFYRALLFPQRWYELDENQEPIHYNTRSRQVVSGKYYTNNGFWDTYKSVYPLLSLIAPEVYGDILEGLLSAYQDTGFLPKWLSPDERGMMPGTLVDAIIADAAVKKIRPDLMPAFLEAMIKTADTESSDNKYGRQGSQVYQKLGYIPNHFHESVNQTQDYAYSDFCISQVATTLGLEDTASCYQHRSLNYRNLVDTNSAFLRSKDEMGQFRADFDPMSWGQDYTEGSAYQNSLAFYHDILGYVRLIGGREVFAQHLEELCNQEPRFTVGGYGFEIHEMSEMAALDFGQIAISNQPSFHLPYLYHYIGQPHWSQLILKNLISHAFTNQAYPGDEDNGSMSSWFILNSLGIYPVTPGSGQYLIGIPNLDRAQIQLPEGKSIQINCKGNLPQYQFVKEVHFNKKPYSKLYLHHEDLIKGCQLDFQLGLVPPLKTYSQKDLPYSLTS
ncbi:alpha-1,2-mannosidase [Streptococcus varani]|uniref:Alpha-1,2-mannosidase n=1 Tax=Streptococcus varani TaxID=1608583 RepID=A0A0E4CTE6_9STRE|nr:GH92 family glycosyl hydrolase [Streptococcus varani]CQR25666.1 alpha-1,2-mannosidase [Streptococcus varani]